MRNYILFILALLFPFNTLAAPSHVLNDQVFHGYVEPYASAQRMGSSSAFWNAYLTGLFGNVTSDASAGNVDTLATTDKYIVRLTGAVTNLRGIANGASGKEIVVVNASGSDLTVKNADSNPTAANRILTGSGADLTMKADAAFRFAYDATSARWRIAGGGGGGTDFIAVAPIAYNVGTKNLTCDVASGSQPGCLAAADFTTFNGKQSQDADLDAIAALTGTGYAARTGSNTWALRTFQATAPIQISNPAGVAGNPTVSCDVASDSQPGCLSAADHVAFGGKQAAGDYATSGSGDVAWSAHVGSGAVTTTIGANKVVNSMLAQMANGTFKCRTSSGTGNAEDCTASQASALLAAFTGDSGSGGVKGVVPAPTAGDAAKRYFLSAGGGFSAIQAVTQDYGQSAHGFAVGNLVYFNGTIFAKAKADSDATSEVLGIVSNVPGSNNFSITQVGYVSGLSGLVAGTTYYLDDSVAGGLTATQPTTVGHISKPVLVAFDTTSGYFFNMRGVTIAATASTPLEFSGFFDGSNGSTCAVTTSLPAGKFASCTRNSTGNFTVTSLASGCSSAPVCVYSCTPTAGVSCAVMSNAAATTTSLGVQIVNSSWASLDQKFSIHCSCSP